MDREQIVAATREVMQKHAAELSAAYVFGSTARGTHRATSDVDLAILYREAPPASLSGLGFDIAHELELALHRPVDMVVLNTASADLAHRVLRDGVIVLDADRKARVAFEVHARGQYFDLAPLRKLFRSTREQP